MNSKLYVSGMTRFYVVLLTFMSIFSLQANAQDAKIVSLATWGSNAHSKITKINEFYFLSQQYSQYLDVIDSTKTGADSLVKQMEFESNIREIHVFNGHLVVIHGETLHLYDVNDLDAPIPVFSVAVESMQEIEDAIVSNDQYLIYANSNGKIFVIEADGENFRSLGAVEFGVSLPENSYVSSLQALGVDNSSLYVMQQIRNLSGFNTKELYFREISLTTQLSVSNEYREAVPDSSYREASYIESGTFALIDHPRGVEIYTQNGTEFRKVVTINRQDFPYAFSKLTYSDGYLRLLSNSAILQKYNINNLLNPILIEETSLRDAQGTFPNMRFFGMLEEDLFVVHQAGVQRIFGDAEDNLTAESLYFQGGPTGRLVAKDNKLYIPRLNRIDILDIADKLDPKIVSQQRFPSTNHDLSLDLIDNRIFSSNPSTVAALEINGSLLEEQGTLRFDDLLSNRLISQRFMFGATNYERLTRYELVTDNVSASPMIQVSTNENAERRSTLGDLQIAENRLYALKNENETILYVFDDIYGSEPILLDTIQLEVELGLEQGVHDYAAYQDYIYLLTPRTVEILKVNADASIENMGSISLFDHFGGSISAVNIVENNLVLFRTSNVLNVALYSLASKSNPSFISKSELDSFGFGTESELTFEQGYLYITGEFSGDEGRIRILQLNKAPTFNNNAFLVDEDNLLKIDISRVDEENDQVSFDVLNSPNNGELEIQTENNNVIYTPNSDYFGEDSIVIQMTDIHGNTSISSLKFTVLPVDDLPVTQDLTEQVLEGESVSGSLPVKDIDGETLTYTVVTTTLNGTLNLDSIGTYSYLANTGFLGSDSFEYEVADESGNLVQGKVSFAIRAKPVVPPPVTPSASGGGSLGWKLLLLVGIGFGSRFSRFEQ